MIWMAMMETMTTMEVTGMIPSTEGLATMISSVELETTRSTIIQAATPKRTTDAHSLPQSRETFYLKTT